MKYRFYRTAEPGGGSGAADNPAPANQPGAPGGDGIADPNKSAVSADVAKPAGSGGDISTQPKEPQTIEEAKELLAAERARIAEFEGKLTAQDKEHKDTLKALKEKAAAKINKLNSLVKVPTGIEDEGEIKARGADGKFTPKDIEEANARAYRKAIAEQNAQQVEEAMSEYVAEFAKAAGMKDAELVALDEDLAKYRRAFGLMDGEKDTDPVATPEEQMGILEDLIRGRMGQKLIDEAYARGKADAERTLAAKLGGDGPSGGAPPPGGTGSGQPVVQPTVHPSAAAAMKSFERLAG